MKKRDLLKKLITHMISFLFLANWFLSHYVFENKNLDKDFLLYTNLSVIMVAVFYFGKDLKPYLEYLPFFQKIKNVSPKNTPTSTDASEPHKN